jgi:hypothetical protein
MKANFRERLEKHVQSTLTPAGKKTYRAHHAARSALQHAIKAAQEALSRSGYFLGMVTDSGSMVSLKLYGPSLQRDYKKTSAQLSSEFGYPINLEFSADDNRGVMIFSLRQGGGDKPLVQSFERKQIEDALYAELESQIKAGIEFLKTQRSGGR